MASSGIVRNDKTGELMVQKEGKDGMVWINKDGKVFPEGKGCAGGWTLLPYKTAEKLTDAPAKIKSELAKVPAKERYNPKTVAVAKEIIE